MGYFAREGVEKITTDREKLLEEALEQVKLSHKWMLESIVHKADELQEGNFSDELKHAISVGELLETL